MPFFSANLFRRIATAIGVAFFLGFAHLSLAQADAPQIGTQVPGYYRLMIGQFEVTALFDGAFELDSQLLTNAKPADIHRLLQRRFVGTSKMQTAVNSYLINTGKHLVLIDAGAGKYYGPSVGFMLQNLRAAGYDPKQVDTIILTHLHGDHIGGLVDTAGNPVFPNANVYVDKADHDYFLSQKNADAAPPERKRMFKTPLDIASVLVKKGKWHIFSDRMELVPGITAMGAYGHTPGHTGFLVESQERSLFIWGDLVHSHAVQFARPDVAFEYDVNQQQAVAVRNSLLKIVARSGMLVAGMHLPFPGIGHVRSEGAGSYSWIPIEFSPLKK